jgi:hypothetical protein
MMVPGSKHSFFALSILAGSVFGALAQDGEKPTVGSLIAAGGKVEAIVAAQDWPFFYITTPDKKLFACSMEYDDGFKFFDYRSQPPASVKTRCTELK